MQNGYYAYVESGRAKLKDHGGALLFLSWADVALRQGADPERVVFEVMRYQVQGRADKATDNRAAA